MTLTEMNETVFKGKLSLIGLERMKESNVLPCLYDVPVEDTETFRRRLLQWKSTFVGRFVSKYPRYYGFISRLHSVFGHTPEWSDFTKQKKDDVAYHFPSCTTIRARRKTKDTPSVSIYV